MSRSGYSDDYDDGKLELYRQAVRRAIQGKRGQAFLRELAAALDAMPVKQLIRYSFSGAQGCCTLGCFFRARGIDCTHFELEDYECDLEVRPIAEAAGIAESMAREIMYLNDEGWSSSETPEQRWRRMRKWVEANIVEVIA